MRKYHTKRRLYDTSDIEVSVLSLCGKDVLKRILCIFTAIVTAALALSCAAFADNSANEKIQEMTDGIIRYELEQEGCADVQEWINGSLAENAGSGSEWFAVSLARSGNYDLSAYRNNLIEYISENEISSATARMKNALALIASGYRGEIINETAENSAGVQGIMTLIYGLHLLNNGAVCSRYTVDSITGEILSMQFGDGGWAIMGENGDIDVTAMTVQALAPQYGTNEKVTSAVDRAVTFMSERQLDTGAFQSFGTENPESTAQVLIAVSAIGTDISDERFIKNGHSLIDGIAEFRLADGSFSHTMGGNTNKTATVQSYMALIACVLNSEKNERFYDLMNIQSQDEQAAPTETTAAVPSVTSAPKTIVTAAATTQPEGSATAKTDTGFPAYKITAFIIIGASAAAVCIILILMKKRRASNFVAVIIVAAAAAAFIFFTDFRSKEEYYNSADKEKTAPVGTVTLTIRCDTIVGAGNNEYVPADGVILDTTDFVIEKNDTVYDILTEAARKYNIQLESRSGGYISGINYLYEFDYGDLSGWIYHVNGEAPFVMCSEYELSDGDRIEWLYTCELGNDLN